MAVHLSKTNLRLAVVGALLIGAIVGTAAWLISERWWVDLAESRHADASLAQVLAEQTSRTIQPVDLTLRELQARLEPDGPFSSGNATGWGTRAAFDMLVERRKGLPQVSALVLVGVDGRLVNYSRVFPSLPLDLSIRSYYKYFSTNDDHALFVSEPTRILPDGTWTIQLARRINGPHGEFAGTISATVTLAYLEDFYKAVTPESGAVILLLHDGTVLASYPPALRQVGLKIPVETPWYRILQDGGGDYRTPGAVGSEARLVTVRPLRDYPLVINVSTTEAAVFSGWRQQVRWLLLGGVVAAACVGVLLRVFAAQLGRLERSEASLVRQNAQLENGRLQFNAVLENISQGVTFFDGSQRLIVCNRRYLEIYRLSPEEVPVGTSLSDIIDMRKACGSFVDMTRAEFLARRATLARPGEPYDVTDVLSDGRTVTMHYQPLPNGGWVTTHEDVTERCRNENSLAFMARHDALTELPNRTLFQERLEQAVSGIRHGSLCALLCLDLDRFKVINDTLGHPVGDGLLRAVSARLSASIRDVDTVARLGGDEFAIVLADLKSPEQAALLADRIIEAIRQPYDIDDNRIVAAASIGISLAPDDGISYDTLLKNADIALYIAKTNGRNTYRFFETEMNTHVQELRLVELDLRDALPANQFELHYQPILDLRSGQVSGFEALIRWNHPVRGLISPAHFIPVAEETGLIVPIGEWVLRTACREAATWPHDIEIAVNLSAAQFREAHLFDVVQSALTESGLAPNRLELEITESVLLQSSDDRLALLHQLRALGIRIALDDFGTGYSSLSYLHSFPFDKIKIDQSFIRDVNTNKDSTVIVGAIINLARNLGMTAVAEGVETAQQLATLQDQGCTRVQGYLFSRPRPARDAPALIRTLRVRQKLDPAFLAGASLGRVRQAAVT